VAVMCFTAQSCLCIEIYFLQLPESDQNMTYLYPDDRPLPNFATFPFSENVEFQQKDANSAAWLEIQHSAENCSPYILHTFITKNESFDFYIFTSVIKAGYTSYVNFSDVVLYAAISQLFTCVRAEGVQPDL